MVLTLTTVYQLMFWHKSDLCQNGCTVTICHLDLDLNLHLAKRLFYYSKYSMLVFVVDSLCRLLCARSIEVTDSNDRVCSLSKT